MYLRSLLSLSSNTLNSLTKYPSILTYHALGEKGRLLPQVLSPLPSGPSVVTEKVDGTNVRLIVAYDGSYILGSREELLTVSGDLIPIPTLNIVRDMRERSERIASACSFWHTLAARQQTSLDPIRALLPERYVLVLYGELFGGNIGNAARNYTDNSSQTLFRLFDAWSLSADDFERKLHETPEQLSSWREGGDSRINGQPFYSEDQLSLLAQTLELPLTPRLMVNEPLPTDLEGVDAWLHRVLPASVISGKAAEGVVVRSPTRTHITKIRFEDYERTLRGKRR